MAEFMSKQGSEIDSLAMMLKKNKLASSDSEARRMAEEMLCIGKKVSDDFSEKEKRMYGNEKKNSEVELAHRRIEQLASNLARGRSDIRLGDVKIDMPEIDVDKPLRELMPEEAEPQEADDEDAVEIKEDDSVSEEETPEVELKMPKIDNGSPSLEQTDEQPAGEGIEEEAAQKTEESSEPEAENAVVGVESEPEVENVADDDDNGGDDEGSGDGDLDFSVKELDTKEQLQKSEDERKKERESMPESKVDLSDMFNANK